MDVHFRWWGLKYYPLNWVCKKSALAHGKLGFVDVYTSRSLKVDGHDEMNLLYLHFTKLIYMCHMVGR